MCCGLVFQRFKYIEIGDCVKRYLYDWILHHTQVIQSPIENYFHKVSIDSYYET